MVRDFCDFKKKKLRRIVFRAFNLKSTEYPVYGQFRVFSGLKCQTGLFLSDYGLSRILSVSEMTYDYAHMRIFRRQRTFEENHVSVTGGYGNRLLFLIKQIVKGNELSYSRRKYFQGVSEFKTVA